MKQSKLCFLRIMLNFIELITLYEQVYLFLIYQYRDREIEMIMIIHQMQMQSLTNWHVKISKLYFGELATKRIRVT